MFLMFFTFFTISVFIFIDEENVFFTECKQFV